MMSCVDTRTDSYLLKNNKHLLFGGVLRKKTKMASHCFGFFCIDSE